MPKYFNKLGIKTVANLLSRPYEEIRDSFADYPQRLDELNEMCLALTCICHHGRIKRKIAEQWVGSEALDQPF